MNVRFVPIPALLMLWCHSVALGQLSDSVVGSPHDLSALSGPGTVRAVDEDRICIFCHAPHNTTGQAPLWNRDMPPTHYRIYESSTIQARIDQPSGPSKMCLSCHDGALAIALLASEGPRNVVPLTRRRMPPGPTDLTQDLSDDHPIGFRYDRALFRDDDQLRNPDVLTDELPLGVHNEVHCTTCHDAHDNSLGDFLRVPQERAAICLACHKLDGWEAGAHARSPRSVPGRLDNPRDPLPHASLADNGCASCHAVHGAAGRERLLKFRNEEDNCLTCHSGGVGGANILSELRKRSGHPVQRFEDIHQPNEDPRSMRAHVECTDCHNPHAAQENVLPSNGRVTRGRIDNTLRFVSGVDRTGRPIEQSRFEYEVCFKCHADTRATADVVGGRPPISRQITQQNTRQELQPNNPSFHPVIAPRRNNDVVSLIPPYQVGDMVKCTDCHNSDAAPVVAGVNGAPRGPHGSIHEPLLIANYTTSDFTNESPQAYALCYQCHDRQSILNDESFPLHSEHILRGQAPCSACHDAHGISRRQGSSRNHSNLINFDLSLVQPADGALGRRLEFEDTGRYSGSCTLTCHSVTHVRFTYQP